MHGYRIRLGGTETTVADAPALVALARAGRLRSDDEVYSGGDWVSAERVPELRGHLGTGGDPWAAWSDVESVDAATLYRKMVDRGEPPELPVDALEPVSEPVSEPAVSQPASSGQPRALAPSGLAPLDLAPSSALPGDGGELIAFPGARPSPRGAPPLRDPLPSFGSRRPAPPPPLVRTGRLAAMIVAGLLCMALVYGWIQVGAWSQSGVSASTPRPLADTRTPAPPSPLALLEQELRTALPATPRLVEKDGDLSDALLLELVQLRVDVVNADGHVTKWVGRHLDEPKKAEVRIQYRSTGDISREMGAIAMVVGRYKRLYRLDIGVFEVTEMAAQGQTRIDPDKAEALYQARLSLEKLLASIVAQ